MGAIGGAIWGFLTGGDDEALPDESGEDDDPCGGDYFNPAPDPSCYAGPDTISTVSYPGMGASPSNCDTWLIGVISNYLAGKGSPRASDAALFVQAGDNYDVDPRLMVAIAGIESGFGTSHAATADNNPFGLLTQVDGKWQPIDFSSVGRAINSAGKTLGSHIWGANQQTVDALYSGQPGAYCSTAECLPPPPGSKRTSAAQKVTNFLTAMGGDPNQLKSPCDQSL